METVWLIIAIILVLSGLLGTVIPMLPGVPLIYAGFLLQGITTHWRDFGAGTMIILGMVTLSVVLIDFYAGAIGAKRTGASQAGVWGGILGGVVGVVVLNLPGLIVGPLVGAVVGELAAGKSSREALRAGWGAFVGFVAGSLLKISVALIMTGMFFFYLLRGG